MRVGGGGKNQAQPTTTAPAAQSTSGAATTTQASPSALQAEAKSAAAGDIPDNQVYVPYAVPGGKVSLKVPEGWARRTSGTSTVFTDNLNSVTIRVTNAARTFGQALGASYRRRRGDGQFRTLSRVLDRLGAEPYDDGGVVRFRNCPFDTVAARYPELVCGTNLSLVQGVIEGLEVDRLKARLDSQPGQCCVAIARSSAKGGRNA